MYPNQSTLQQTRRKKTRTGGLSVCPVLRSSLIQLEDWSHESSSKRSELCQEARYCTRRPTCTQSVHLYAYTHSHTWTAEKEFLHTCSSVETSLAVTDLTDSCDCLVLCSRCGWPRCMLHCITRCVHSRGESDTVSVSVGVSQVMQGM